MLNALYVTLSNLGFDPLALLNRKKDDDGEEKPKFHLGEFLAGLFGKN